MTERQSTRCLSKAAHDDRQAGLSIACENSTTRDDRHPDWWAGIEAMAMREAQERREREHEEWLARMRAAGLLP